jgi:transcriptional regulator with XRE-family HTH domain
VAINIDTWQQAKAMFEGGSSLSEIADKTGIDRSTVSKKAKCQTWQKAKNEQLIADDVKLALNKSTLNQHEISYHEQAVKFQLRTIKAIQMFSNKTMTKACRLMDGAESGSDFKAIIDGVDKLSILIKINDRHQKPTQIQQNTQTAMADALVYMADRLPD